MDAHVDDSKILMKYGDFRINPAPLMTYSQESLTTDGGERVADRVTLSFTGTVLNLDNISSGDFSALITKRDQLINALSGNGLEFQILHHINSTSASGTPIISGIYPRVENLTFDEGVWVDQIPYSFELVYETNFTSGTVPVETFSDNWSFEEDENSRVIRASHNVSAQGINTNASGDSNAMTNARTWVLARMGVSTIPAGLPAFADSGTLGDLKFQKYRTEAASEIEGTYEATENIVLALSGFANSYTAQYQTNDEGITTVSINGNIEGLGRFDTAIENAVSGWNNHVQPGLSGLAADVYSGFGGSGTLNVSNQQSFSVTKDPFDGRLGYSVSYTDNPAENLPSGITELSISKQINFPLERVAAIDIPGRAAGAVLHKIGAPTNGSVTINGSLRGVPTTQVAYMKQVAEDEVNAIAPNSALYNEFWLQTFTTTEDEKTKQFSFNLVWGFTDNLVNVQDPSGTISF